MRSLKDSRQLGIASVKHLQDVDLLTEVIHNRGISILEAFKAGADWQLRTSEKNYRVKHAKAKAQMADDWGRRYKGSI